VLSLPSGVRLFVATTPTDLRKSYDGLGALVQSEFEMSPTSGDLFIFLNRRATQVRILFWDRDGYCVLMKRLERGTFRQVTSEDGRGHMEIEAVDLAMLLEGIDVEVVRRRKRYRPASMAKTTPAASESEISRSG